MNQVAYLSCFSTLKLFDYVLVYGARWILLLDGDSLILLDVIYTIRYSFFRINICCWRTHNLIRFFHDQLNRNIRVCCLLYVPSHICKPLGVVS